jgi:hypothetical protein
MYWTDDQIEHAGLSVKSIESIERRLSKVVKDMEKLGLKAFVESGHIHIHQIGVDIHENQDRIITSVWTHSWDSGGW